MYVNADPRPLHKAIESIRAANPAAVKSVVAGDWLQCALAERDAAAAKEALSALEDSEIEFGGQIVFNRAFVEAAGFDRADGKRRAHSTVSFCCRTRAAGKGCPSAARFLVGVVAYWV